MTDSAYDSFLSSKAETAPPVGISHGDLRDDLFPFQRDVVAWALRRGRAAIFADCGMGKTLMQLEWASHVPGRVLILAPLAVAQQTVAEGAKFGIPCEYARDCCGNAAITVTNYEMLSRFDVSDFAGVVLDESSILKSYTGKIRTAIIESFESTPYKLACTATPAPNDHTELANHAEFLGICKRQEMLSTYFVHDGGETQKWRLKGHAVDVFWKWVAGWAVMLRLPSDLGYPDDGFVLPPKEYVQHVVNSNGDGHSLFPVEAQTLIERQAARRESIQSRVECAAAMVNDSAEPWIVWCNLNKESEALARAIPDAVEVTGSLTLDAKTQRLMGFTTGDHRVLVTKPRIAGFGMNWQHCRNILFVGLSDSWEQYYQAVRRCWRFGQTRDVRVHVVTAETEGAVVRNIKDKESAALEMSQYMVEHMRAEMGKQVRSSSLRKKEQYSTATDNGTGWDMHLGDCVEIMRGMDTDSIHYSMFSPPFASLYTYSASERDMGNSKDMGEFVEHFRFAVDELFRVTMPGRLLSFHCMNLPTSKSFHGYIGIQDFRGDLIRMFVAAGFIFHSEVVIWKDPVTSMQRTKALGLLHKQIRKDSCMSRQGIPDYVVTMRKPGENPQRVPHTHDEFPVSVWQRYASPVWMDINASKTLQKTSAREDKDERHICPLQLQVIERCIKLWSNPGDLVLSPFAGIGSEGYVAIENERRFVGCELKRSYYDQAIANLRISHIKQATRLFV